jgi:hypothetical protein
MHRVRLSVLTGLLAVALLVFMGLPALGLAATGPASPLLRTTASSAAALAPVAAAHARQANQVAKEADIQAALAKAAELEAAQAAQAAQAAKAARAARKTSAAKTTKPSGTPVSASPRGSELAQAQSILASLRAKYPRYLSGVTVSIGNASGYQAVAYYTSGRIVISPSHKASLSRILNHEIWHIIDWRDNGRIDWRESVPPANASSFR